MGAHGGGIAVFTEDTYGVGFVRRLSEKLGLCCHKRLYKRLAGVCNSKSIRQLKTAALDYEKVIVLVDGHWRASDVKKAMDKHLGKLEPELRSRIHLIIIESEIEEWICESLGLSYRGLKPSHVLSDYLCHERGYKYEKSMLPEFADIIDPGKLMNNRSFKSFIRALKDP